MVYDRRWVSHRNEAEAFDGFIKIDNIEKNKNLFLNKGMTIRKPFIIYVTEKKNNNRRNNAKKRKNAKWRNNAKKSTILRITLFQMAFYANKGVTQRLFK